MSPSLPTAAASSISLHRVCLSLCCDGGDASRFARLRNLRLFEAFDSSFPSQRHANTAVAQAPHTACMGEINRHKHSQLCVTYSAGMSKCANTILRKSPLYICVNPPDPQCRSPLRLHVYPCVHLIRNSDRSLTVTRSTG